MPVEPAVYRVFAVSVAFLLSGCNQTLDLRLPDPAVRFIAFGDSTTGGPARHDYADDLPNLLGQPANAFTKETHGGETAQDGETRLQSLLTRKLFPNAHTLLYWEGAAGLIDFIKDHDPLLVLSPADPGFPFAQELEQKLQDVQNSIESAVKQAQDAGLQVFVATYYFLADGSLKCDPLLLNILLPGQVPLADQYVTRLNDHIRRAAANRGADLVDVGTLDPQLRGNESNYYNCNHLSAAGNDIVARLWAQAIQNRGAPGRGG